MEICNQILLAEGPLSANAVRKKIADTYNVENSDPTKALDMLWILAQVNREPGPRNSRIYTFRHDFRADKPTVNDADDETLQKRLSMVQSLRDIADWLEETIPARYFDED